MKYRVVVLSRAQRDLNAISDWLHERSPAGAENWAAAFDAALARVADAPEGYGLAEEADEIDVATVRQFIIQDAPRSSIPRGLCCRRRRGPSTSRARSGASSLEFRRADLNRLPQLNISESCDEEVRFGSPTAHRGVAG
jgi:plasmid stabilization system protein ParE